MNPLDLLDQVLCSEVHIKHSSLTLLTVAQMNPLDLLDQVLCSEVHIKHSSLTRIHTMFLVLSCL
jgi:hypothetical protein